MDYIAIGMRIRQKRLEHGWKIAELAEKAEIGDDYMGKIERGQGIASLETIVNIANALETGLDALIGKDLTCVSDYLNNDINKAIGEMNNKQKKEFLEFINFITSYFKSK